jgi:hypothetical protein
LPWRVWRLAVSEHQEAVDELEAFSGVEHAQFDEVVVFVARPAPEHLRRRQGAFHR